MTKKNINQIFSKILKKIPTFWFLVIIIFVNVLIVLPYGILYLPEDSEIVTNPLMWITISLVILWSVFSLLFSIHYFRLRQDILLEKQYIKIIKRKERQRRKKMIKESASNKKND